MSLTPGADELRIRHYLRDLELDHNPGPPEDDWWAALYPDDDTPSPDGLKEDPDDPPDGSGWLRKLSGHLPPWAIDNGPDLRGSGPEPDPDGPDEDGQPEEEWEETADPDDPARRTPRNPARTGTRRAASALAELDHRTRWLVVNGGAAALGWGLGIEQLFNGWITGCAHDEGQAAGLILGLGLVGAGSYLVYRARGWWPPLAWCCRIPLATAILAMALYAPGVTP